MNKLFYSETFEFATQPKRTVTVPVRYVDFKLKTKYHGIVDI